MKRFYKQNEAQERILLLEGTPQPMQIISETVECTPSSYRGCSLVGRSSTSAPNDA